MHPMLNIAIRAVRKAGNLIAKYYEILDVVETIQKGTNDFITNVNLEVERLIVEVIYKSYPQHAIRVKGNVVRAGKNNEVEWIIDPLSGTTNFVKRFPYFAVSITARIKDRTEITVVYDPMRNELFSASRGQGAQLNGYRLRGSTARDLDSTILATGFPFKNKQHFTNYTNIISELFTQCADFRYTGSATLDLAYVAAGRVDGFFETCMKPWDFAGGELLVREAGGLVTDVTGDYNYLRSGNIVAGGNPHVVKSMLLILRAALSEALNIS